MKQMVELSDQELRSIDGGKKEWILLGCLISPVVACFAIGFYLEYNS